jgi:predicted metalloenzyme YecM
MDEYLEVRQQLEAHCKANVENVWNGRPISKMLLAEPLSLGNGATVDLIEVLPPVHRIPVVMGLEHVGIVVGESIEEFASTHKAAITGQQHQSEFCEPYLVTFHDLTTVKFYRYSLHDVCVKEGHVFDDFHHVV